MFTHPDLIGFSVKQHMNDLMAEAEHERVLTAALRRRRDARHAAREARHHVDATGSGECQVDERAGGLRRHAAGSVCQPGAGLVRGTRRRTGRVRGRSRVGGGR